MARGSAPRCGVDLDGAGLRQQSRIIDDAWIATLCLYDFHETLRGRPGANQFLKFCARLAAARHHAAEDEHLDAEGVRHFHEIGRPVPCQRLNRFFDLERIPHGASKRPVHRRQQRHRRAVVAVADADHLFRERQLFIERRDE